MGARPPDVGQGDLGTEWGCQPWLLTPRNLQDQGIVPWGWHQPWETSSPHRAPSTTVPSVLSPGHATPAPFPAVRPPPPPSSDSHLGPLSGARSWGVYFGMGLAEPGWRHTHPVSCQGSTGRAETRRSAMQVLGGLLGLGWGDDSTQGSGHPGHPSTRTPGLCLPQHPPSPMVPRLDPSLTVFRAIPFLLPGFPQPSPFLSPLPRTISLPLPTSRSHPSPSPHLL